MSFLLIRATTLAVAIVVGAAGLWTAISQAFAPALGYFPVNAQEAQAFDNAHEAAHRAAQVAVLRGDQWTIAAITESAPILFTPAGSKLSREIEDKITDAMAAAEHAARLSPHDARNWLILADLRSRSPRSTTAVAEALKLSYYTGSNRIELAPVRLAVAGRIEDDEELLALVQTEISRVVLKRPDLKPSVVAAYKTATPSMRKAFESTLKDTAPDLMKSLAIAKEQ